MISPEMESAAKFISDNKCICTAVTEDVFTFHVVRMGRTDEEIAQLMRQVKVMMLMYVDPSIRLRYKIIPDEAEQENWTLAAANLGNDIIKLFRGVL